MVIAQKGSLDNDRNKAIFLPYIGLLSKNQSFWFVWINWSLGSVLENYFFSLTKMHGFVKVKSVLSSP